MFITTAIDTSAHVKKRCNNAIKVIADLIDEAAQKGGFYPMNDCIFCKIAQGDIPSSTIYEDDDFRVILDLGPATKGHALILPKKHFRNIFEMD